MVARKSKVIKKPATKKRTRTVKAIVPGSNIDLAADAGIGQELMTGDDYAIPRLSILQALSPHCTKGTDEYNSELEAGMFFNSVTGEGYDGEDGIYIIPITYRRTNIEWRLRANGGGFIADHGVDYDSDKLTKRNELGQFINEAGNQIVNTAEYFAFIIDVKTGETTPVVISMTSSQLKKSRRLNSMINQLLIGPENARFNPAMFYRSYLFRTVPESNDKGNWFGYSIMGSDDIFQYPNGEQTYQAAKTFRASVISGEVRASKPNVEVDHADDDNSPM